MDTQNNTPNKPDILLESFTQEDFETARKNLLQHFRFWQGLLISNDERSIITPDDLDAFRLQASEISTQEIKSAQEIEQLKVLTVLIYLLTSADTSTADPVSPTQYPLINSYIVKRILSQAASLDLETIQKLLHLQNQIYNEQDNITDTTNIPEPQTLAQNLRCRSGEQITLLSIANQLTIAFERPVAPQPDTDTNLDPEKTEPIDPIVIETTSSALTDPNLQSQVLMGDGAHHLKDMAYYKQLPCGAKLCAATYIGINREQNEDAIIISPAYDQLIVIDAMGGYGNGNIAREIFIQSALSNPNDIEATVLKTQKQYDHFQLQYGGVCLTHLHITQAEPKGYTLHISQAGDVHTALFDQHGNLRYESKDESIGHRVFNAIISKSATDMQRANGWNKFGTLTRTKINVEHGWRIAVYSDGISNHITADTLKQLIIGNTLEQALDNISSSIDSAMQEPESYQDNCSLALIDF